MKFTPYLLLSNCLWYFKCSSTQPALPVLACSFFCVLYLLQIVISTPVDLTLTGNLSCEDWPTLVFPIHPFFWFIWECLCLHFGRLVLLMELLIASLFFLILTWAPLLHSVLYFWGEWTCPLYIVYKRPQYLLVILHTWPLSFHSLIMLQLDEDSNILACPKLNVVMLLATCEEEVWRSFELRSWNLV